MKLRFLKLMLLLFILPLQILAENWEWLVSNWLHCLE